MTNTRWLLAVIVLAAALFGAGWWAGQRPIDPAWTARTDSLLADSVSYRHTVDSLRAMSDSAFANSERLSTIAVQLAGQARHTEEAARRLQDSLANLATAARSATDSLALLPGKDAVIAALDTVITAKDDQLHVERAISGQRWLALETYRAKSSLDSTRIADLTRQLSTAPQPPRPAWSLLGVSVKPCGFAGLTPKGVTYGAGMCISRL